MQGNPRGTLLCADVAAMVNISEEWLQEKSSNHHGSENGVRIFVKLRRCVSWRLDLAI